MTKTDYQNQAREFLNKCPAEMTIIPAGEAVPNWDNKPHRLYICTIKTQRGRMTINFYDSLHNTEIWKMTPGDYIEKHLHCHRIDATYQMKTKAIKAVEQMRKEASPTEYDILACLQKYDVGTMDEFFTEFGYEIKSAKDITNFIDTYNAVTKEYRDLCRIFTPEQMDDLREIN